MKLAVRLLLTMLFVVLWFGSGAAQDPVCTCDNTTSSVCGVQGFRITLVDYSVDQNAGVSTWDYRVCDESGMGTGCDAPRDLGHIDLSLPQLGTCLTTGQMISLVQVSDFDRVTLACGVSERDPSCDIFGTPGSDFVAKCDVAASNPLDPGDCVTMRLSIAGEQPTLGAGAAMTVTKAGPECGIDCLLGPSCEPCQSTQDECLTRTSGFWGTHPHITGLFLPVTVCGIGLTGVEAGSCHSASEAMCVSGGRESGGNPAYIQLVRQLAAAKLNLAATAANGGVCSPDVDLLIADCEMLCGADKKTISDSGCIEALAAFNESADTLPITPPPFDSPGPANPRECQLANGNGVLVAAPCP